MAATAHPDSYAIFMRKIGYSVGLEDTLQRVSDLHALYKSSKDVTISSWNELVSSPDHWKLKSDNITDVFYSLRLIQKTSSDLLVLENLDAMTIACALLETQEEQRRAKEFLLLWAIITNDGEIFVNLLLADFEEAKIKETLSAVIEKKRDILCDVLPGRDSRKRIYRIVNIERQGKNRGSTGSGKSVASLNRVEPLKNNRTLPVVDEFDHHTVEFSDDYFRKVPPRRKDWARSLGLWDDKCGLTQKGVNFAEGLRKKGYIDENGLFTLWPMDYELIRSGFRPDLLGKVYGLWETLADFGNVYAGLYIRPTSEKDSDEMVEIVEKMMKVFREFHVRKSLLRRELPITIAYPAIMAFAIAREESVFDLHSALKSEQEGEERRIAFRKSRNTGGALSLRK